MLSPCKEHNRLEKLMDMRRTNRNAQMHPVRLIELPKNQLPESPFNQLQCVQLPARIVVKQLHDYTQWPVRAHQLNNSFSRGTPSSNSARALGPRHDLDPILPFQPSGSSPG